MKNSEIKTKGLSNLEYAKIHADLIHDSFNYDLVLKAMHAVNWRYFGTKTEKITLNEIKRCARSMLDSCLKNYELGEHEDYPCWASGGFHAEIRIYPNDRPFVDLKFVLTEKGSDWFEGVAEEVHENDE